MLWRIGAGPKLVTVNPMENLTGIYWYIDVHVIDLPAAATLRRMNDEGWIYLQVTDTLITEVTRSEDAAKRERLLDLAADYVIAMGPLVLGHSGVGRSVIGSPEDEARLKQVYALLWPDNDYAADGAMVTGTGRSRFRDAIHVATAIRYGVDGFVTNDPGILARADDIRDAFPQFIIRSVADAEDKAMKRIAVVRRRATLMGRPRPEELPSWPDPADDDV